MIEPLVIRYGIGETKNESYIQIISLAHERGVGKSGVKGYRLKMESCKRPNLMWRGRK